MNYVYSCLGTTKLFVNNNEEVLEISAWAAAKLFVKELNNRYSNFDFCELLKVCNTLVSISAFRNCLNEQTLKYLDHMSSLDLKELEEHIKSMGIGRDTNVNWTD